MKGWDEPMRTNALPVAVENLEDRRLFAAGASLFAGMLRVHGEAGSLNTITLDRSLDGLTYNLNINSVNALGQTKTFTRSYTATDVSAVWIRGGFRSDTILVGQGANTGAFALPVRVDGGAGDDFITTDGGNDVVFAGAGDDVVETGGGNDWVRGMLGNDRIEGGGEDDRLTGGAGNDTIDAGGGNDVVRGDFGNDTIEAGRGDDVVYAGLGDDTVFGEDGNDILWGGGGNDILWGGDDNDTLGGILGTNALRGEAGIDTFVVRNLTLNPSNDYDATLDLLTVVNTSGEGGRQPAM